MVSITRLNLQYAHRFLNYEGEAQYLHGHTGLLTVEIAGEVDARTGFVHPCNGAKRIIWDYLKHFDHALILQESDPLLPGVLKAYEEQGIRDGAPTNTMLGLTFDTELAKAYPECRLLVVKEVATCENLIKVFHSLLKDKLNIHKMTFTSEDNAASETYR